MRAAGQIAIARWPGHGHALDSWDKQPGDPVSVADLEVDQFLKRELSALLPAAGWLSEETIDAPERLAADLIWLVDLGRTGQRRAALVGDPRCARAR